MRSLYAIAFIAGLAVTAAVAQQGAAGRASRDGPVALGGTLIDGTGKAPVRDSVVLIRGGRIEVVGTTESLPVPNGYETVSTEGMTVLAVKGRIAKGEIPGPIKHGRRFR